MKIHAKQSLSNNFFIFFMSYSNDSIFYTTQKKREWGKNKEKYENENPFQNMLRNEFEEMWDVRIKLRNETTGEAKF